MTKVKRVIVLGVLVLCAAVGVAVPAASQTIPPPRYQVISDMLDLQQRIESLERDNAELREDMREMRGQIGALVLLRAYDIGFNQRTRAEDQKRVTALEWAVAGQKWPRCDLGDTNK